MPGEVQSSGEDVLGSFIDHIAYDDGRLVIVDTGLKTFDVESGECTFLTYQNLNYVKNLSSLEDDIFYATTTRGISLFDRLTNEFVFISE